MSPALDLGLVWYAQWCKLFEAGDTHIWLPPHNPVIVSHLNHCMHVRMVATVVLCTPIVNGLLEGELWPLLKNNLAAPFLRKPLCPAARSEQMDTRHAFCFINLAVLNQSPPAAAPGPQTPPRPRRRRPQRPAARPGQPPPPPLRPRCAPAWPAAGSVTQQWLGAVVHRLLGGRRALHRVEQPGARKPAHVGASS